MGLPVSCQIAGSAVGLPAVDTLVNVVPCALADLRGRHLADAQLIVGKTLLAAADFRRRRLDLSGRHRFGLEVDLSRDDSQVFGRDLRRFENETSVSRDPGRAMGRRRW